MALFEEYKELILWGWWSLMSLIMAWTVWNNEQKGVKPNIGGWFIYFVLFSATEDLIEYYRILPTPGWGWELMEVVLSAPVVFGEIYLFRYLIRRYFLSQNRQAVTGDSSSFDNK